MEGGGGVFHECLSLSLFSFFNSHGDVDTLESYEVCCSACVLPVIGQVQHWDMERNRAMGRIMGRKKHGICLPLSFCFLFLKRYLEDFRATSAFS